MSRMLLLAVALAFLACGEPRREPPPRPTPTATATPDAPDIGNIGDRLATGPWRITLHEVARPGPVLQWNNPAGRAQAAGEFLVAHLTVEHLASRKAGLIVTDFQVLSKEGGSFPASSCCLAYATSLGARGLTFASEFEPGVSSKLLVVFDIHPGTAGLSLVFTQGKGLAWKLE